MLQSVITIYSLPGFSWSASCIRLHCLSVTPVFRACHLQADLVVALSFMVGPWKDFPMNLFQTDNGELLPRKNVRVSVSRPLYHEISQNTSWTDWIPCCRARGTHWKQTVFYLTDILTISKGEILTGNISFSRLFVHCFCTIMVLNCLCINVASFSETGPSQGICSCA